MSEPTFAERLRELREAANLTQDQLAERAGMNRFGIAKLEQGKRDPTWSTVQALAKALGVSCAAFEGTVASKPEPPAPRPLGRPRKAPPAEQRAAQPGEAKKRRKKR